MLSVPRSMLAMASIAITSPQTRLTNPKCGLKPGLDGKSRNSRVNLFFYYCFTVISVCFPLMFLQVYKVWRPSSLSSSWRYGLFRCKVYPKGWLFHQLLYGKAKVAAFVYLSSYPFLSYSNSHTLVYCSVSRWNKFWSNCWWPVYCNQLWLWCSSRRIW